MAEDKLLTGFFEALPFPAYVVNTDLKLVFVNRAARVSASGAGIDIAHLEGQYLLDTLTFLPARTRDDYERVLRTGQPISEEKTYEINGTKVCVEVSRFPVSDDGRVTHIGVVYREVTELKEAQEALRQSEETARALMNSSTESMFLIDENETLIVANAIGAQRLGFPVAELEGMTIDQMMPPDIGSNRTSYYRQVRTSGKPVRFSDKRGGRIFDISMFPAPGPGGLSRRVAVFARDITDYESMLRALGESEVRFRDLFENIPVPTFVFQWDGSDFVLQRANAAADRLTGGKIESLLGRNATAMYAQQSPWIIENLKKSFSTKGDLVREVEHTLQTTGETKFFEAHYVYVYPDEVMVHAVDRTARREADLALQEAYASLEQRVVERTRELGALNDQLRVERESLNQKNAALRELIVQVNDSKKTLASHIQTNLRQVALPILERLGTRLDDTGKNYLQMLREALDDILSPHLTELKRIHPQLTPHEVDLCNLIKSGFTCKEIAEMRGRSEQTILKQRKLIRRKLGLSDEKINLRNYLTSVGTEIYSK